MQSPLHVLILLCVSTLTMAQYNALTPEFPGGEAALEQFIASNIQYPTGALHLGTDEALKVQIKVDSTGKILQVVTWQSDEYGFADEAIRLVQLMPKWTPAQENGHATESKHTFFVTFDYPKQNLENKKFELAPRFPGGNRSLRDFIAMNLEYPDLPEDFQTAGSVVLRIYINEFGEIADREVINSIGPEFTEAAQAVIDKMPIWDAGIAGGQASGMWYTIPFSFSPNESEKEQPAKAHNFDWALHAKRRNHKIWPIDSDTHKGPDFVAAEFPGGNEGLDSFFQEVALFPKKAVKKDWEGTVKIRFTVTSKGKIKHPVVLNTTPNTLNKAAIKVLKDMPDWTPATKNGVPVDDVIILPLPFEFQD